MKINTKFNLNDLVYLMHDDKLSYAVVQGVNVRMDYVSPEYTQKDISYKVELQGTVIKVPENDLFVSIEEALKYLREGLTKNQSLTETGCGFGMNGDGWQ